MAGGREIRGAIPATITDPTIMISKGEATSANSAPNTMKTMCLWKYANSMKPATDKVAEARVYRKSILRSPGVSPEYQSLLSSTLIPIDNRLKGCLA